MPLTNTERSKKWRAKNHDSTEYKAIQALKKRQYRIKKKREMSIRQKKELTAKNREAQRACRRSKKDVVVEHAAEFGDPQSLGKAVSRTM